MSRDDIGVDADIDAGADHCQWECGLSRWPLGTTALKPTTGPVPHQFTGAPPARGPSNAPALASARLGPGKGSRL